MKHFPLLSFLFTATLRAQLPYFNIQFDHNNWWETSGYTSVETDSFYLVMGATGTPWVEFADSAFVLKINKFDGTIGVDQVGHYQGQSCTSIIPFRDSYLISGHHFPGKSHVDDVDLFYCLYDPATGIDTSSFHSYGSPGIGEYFFRPIVTSDGGVFSSGWAFKSGIYGQQAIAVKCDSNLNLQYFKKLQAGGGEVYFGTDAVETPDQGIIIVGARWRDNPQPGLTLVDGLIFKLNSTGDLVWWKEYPASADTIEMGYYDIEPLNDGTYMAVGFKTTKQFIGPTWRKYLAVGLDQDGNQLWSKEYLPNDDAAWVRMVPSGDGNFYACGSERDKPFPDSLGEWHYPQYGSVSKLSAAGDLIWHRRYTVELPDKHYDGFYNVMTTSDGGIFCNGKTYQNDTTHQNAWIIKMDSSGCLSPGCDTTSAVADLPVGNNTPFVIAPNPSEGLVRITSKNGERFSSVAVYDMQGKIVRQNTALHTTEILLDLLDQPAGMYFCSLMLDGVLFVRQIVISH